MRLFDLHCDTLTECVQSHQSLYDNTLHWDFNRASTMFESVFQITAVYIQDNVCEKDAWNTFLRIFSFLKGERIPCISCSRDLQKYSKGILLAVENGVILGNNLLNLYRLFDRGVVYLTLTWNGSNLLGNGCLSNNKDGLTMFGKQVVREMFRIGMLPDVSHLNVSGFWDVVELSQDRPFLASHSVSDTVWKHPRNLTDSQFSALIKCRGLVGVNVCESQLGKQSFDQIERHLYHFWSLNGEDRTALGLDLDGTAIPNEWAGITFVLNLYEYFLRKGYSEHLIDKLFFENSYSFFLKSLTSRKKCIRIGA